MANRQFTQFSYQLEKAVVSLFAHIAIGASGAPTINAARSKGVKSIVRNGAGDYTLTLQDSYVALLGFGVTFQVATVPAAPGVSVKTDSVTSAPNGSVRFICSTGGTATDPASGEIMKVSLRLSNSGAI